MAHTEPTLANDYLVRNRGTITDYQRVVADILTTETGKARTHAALRTLTPADVEEARTNPKAVAAVCVLQDHPAGEVRRHRPQHCRNIGGQVRPHE